MQPGLTYGWMNALTAVYGLPAGPLPATNSTQKHPIHSFAAGFMIIDVIGVKWSLVLSNVLLMSARLLLAFTTKTSVAVFVLYFLMPFGQALNIPVRAKMSHFSIVFATFTVFNYSPPLPTPPFATGAHHRSQTLHQRRQQKHRVCPPSPATRMHRMFLTSQTQVQLVLCRTHPSSPTVKNCNIVCMFSTLPLFSLPLQSTSCGRMWEARVLKSKLSRFPASAPTGQSFSPCPPQKTTTTHTYHLQKHVAADVFMNLSVSKLL